MRLARLTAAKAVANTALRWVPPFLPTLERAFGATTGQMTTILGVGEMAGLSTIGVGRYLDRGRERLVMTLALVTISVSSLVALVGTTFTFAVAFLLVVLGVANLTVAGHSTISRFVPYARRARAIGLYETSWAIALLIGAPLIAVLIQAFGWRGPYVVLAVACAVMAAWIWTAGARNPPLAPDQVPASPGIRTLPWRAWAVIVGSALLAMSGLSVFAISGKWLDTAFGVSTGGLGLVAMAFGAFELLASTGSAGFADRIGKLRSVLLGVALLVSGQVVMALADDTLWVGVVGILAFLCGFEFAFVTSLSLVTEAMPQSRGTTIALANGVGTVARGSGTIASGFLFTRWGVHGTISMSAAAAVVATRASSSVDPHEPEHVGRGDPAIGVGCSGEHQDRVALRGHATFHRRLHREPDHLVGRFVGLDLDGFDAPGERHAAHHLRVRRETDHPRLGAESCDRSRRATGAGAAQDRCHVGVDRGL